MGEKKNKVSRGLSYKEDARVDLPLENGEAITTWSQFKECTGSPVVIPMTVVSYFYKTSSFRSIDSLLSDLPLTPLFCY